MIAEGNYIYLNFGNDYVGVIPCKNIINRVYDDGSFLTNVPNNPHCARHTSKDILCFANNSDPIYPKKDEWEKIKNRTS